MVITFSVENFRSFKEKQTLDLTASSGQLKESNVFLANGDANLRLLKSAVIYGPNASGKTNLIRALYTLREFVLESSDYKKGDEIQWHQPFLLDKETRNKPTKFELQFIAKNGIKYVYNIEFDKKNILKELLDFYPSGNKNNLFKRSFLNKVEFGVRLEDKKQPSLLENQLFLSKAANSGNKQLGDVYLYFKETLEVINNRDFFELQELTEKATKALTNPDNEWLRKKVDKLISIADTKIDSLSAKELNMEDFKFPDSISVSEREKIIADLKYRVYANHSVFSNNRKVGTIVFDLREESEGTKALFYLGTLIVQKLKTGGTIFIDELDNSLHPKLCRVLVSIFNNPKSNPRNAQLIFASHEVTLLDKKLFRKDQIWLTEKNKFGSSELFCICDFEGVRDDIPFDKWYMEGKFGGQPQIKELDFIFSDE